MLDYQYLIKKCTIDTHQITNNFRNNSSSTIDHIIGKFNTNLLIPNTSQIINYHILKINKNVDLTNIKSIKLMFGSIVYDIIPFNIIRFIGYLEEETKMDNEYNYFSLELINFDIYMFLCRYHEIHFILETYNTLEQYTTYELVIKRNNFNININNEMESIKYYVSKLVNVYHDSNYNNDYAKEKCITTNNNKDYKFIIDCHMPFVNGIFVECNALINKASISYEKNKTITLCGKYIKTNNKLNEIHNTLPQLICDKIIKYGNYINYVYWIPIQDNLKCNDISMDIHNISKYTSFSSSYYDDRDYYLYLSFNDFIHKKDLIINITYSYYNAFIYGSGMVGTILAR